MPLRITGLNSGLDTESIITELVKAKKANVDKEKKKQTLLEWKQDTWKELNTKLLNLYQKTLGTLRFSNAYGSKKTVSSNESAVSIVTGENAVNGVQNMKVDQLATAGYLTGRQLSTKGSYNASTKLSELGVSGSGSFAITTGGKTTDITVTGDSTIADVVSQLKAAGVNASFDEKNQRFFISAQKTGADNDFSLTATDGNGLAAMEALGINASLDQDEATLRFYTEYAKYYNDAGGDKTKTLQNMQSLIDAEVERRVAAYKASNESIAASLKENAETRQKAADSQAYKDAAGKTSAQLQTELDAAAEEVKSIQDSLKGLTGDEAIAEANKKLEEANKKASDLNSQLANVKIVEDCDAKADTLNKQKAANDVYINTAADGSASATSALTQEVEDAFYAKAEQAADVMQKYQAGTLASGATRIAGQNAQITLNGAVFESDSNTFEINGLTITAKTETSETFTLTTDLDTDNIYNTIKKFITEYNTIINEMDKLYNAEATEYEPLTDDEKDELSDKEIEKWEEKVKASVLRRDDTLNSVASAMKEVMLQGATVDGKQMYLSNFGINTLSYFLAADNERNAYHIDGDEDDANTAGEANTLKAMISSDPETVRKFFTNLCNNLYTKMQSLSSSIDGYRSYNSFYYDKKMKSDYADYTSKIKDLEDKLTAYEDKWYSKFAAMESAMAKMQSNQNALSALLGG